MRIFLFLFCFGFWHTLMSQDSYEWKEGELTFKSSINFYVKFDNTSGIQIGDKLFLNKDTIRPVIEVLHISSTSCVGKKLIDTTFIIGQHFFVNAKITTQLKSSRSESSKVRGMLDTVNTVEDTIPKVKIAKKYRPRYGRFMFSTYSTASSGSEHLTSRYRYTLVTNVKHFGNSKFGGESYISFRHKPGEWKDIKSNVFQYLKIYNLAVHYTIKEDEVISIGRKINLNVSNIGAMDGIQYDKKTNKLNYGMMIGSRPNDADYGLNLKLLQAGLYMGNSWKNKKGGEASNTIAFFEQRNNMKTDRRFVYFQHTNSLLNNLFLFNTLEVDLFKVKENTSMFTLSPSRLYLSARYRPFKKLSLDASFDALKNIIYYESFKNYLDQLIEREMRQGLRFGFTLEPLNSIVLGASGGYRFQAGDEDPSQNADLYLSAYNLANLKLSVTLNATYLKSNYIDGTIFGLRMNKNFFHDRLSVDMNFRKADYQYPYSDYSSNQKIASLGLNMQVLSNLTLNINYEGTFEPNKNYTAVYCNLIKRF